jgi:Rrf2 family protein
MLSESGIYAIRACEFLAQLDDDTVFPTRKISGELGLSNEYLVKVLQNLKEEGIIRSKKGAAGGVQLNRNSRDITLYEIIKATNPSFLDHLIPSEIDDLKLKYKQLHLSLNQQMDDIQDFLNKTTLKQFSDYRSGIQSKSKKHK